jgi:hypothetical protein
MHHVPGKKEHNFTPELGIMAQQLIESGKSTTAVFRALGYKSANRLYLWLADKPELYEKLKANARAHQSAQGVRLKNWR